MGEERIESDFIGKLSIPINALYGIHSARAVENFPYHKPFHLEWYKAVGIVKLAAYQTYKQYKREVLEKYNELPNQLRWIDDAIVSALEESALEISKGDHYNNFIVSAHQGGAGTSINMNVNEIIANRALKKINRSLGGYEFIDPIEDANIYQSTNDVIPTALKVAVMQELQKLEEAINKHRVGIERVENSCRNALRQGYTQMQAAVPSSYDKLFSSYNNALSRDWWRISKCFERIKEVNLGGGAIGTGLSIPRFYIMMVVSNLQQLTKLPISRSENLSDTTSNLDSLVEVHGMLKTHAVNLEKMSSDLRLLGSDLFANREVHLPKKQVGSSIMPAKVNPVIVEYVVSCAHRIYANDNLIGHLSALGCLDLNAYLPAIGDALLESLKMLNTMNVALEKNLWQDIVINNETNNATIFFNPSITAALISKIGYNKAAELSKEMITKSISIYEANSNLHILTEDDLGLLLMPSKLLELGFTLG